MQGAVLPVDRLPPFLRGRRNGVPLIFKKVHGQGPIVNSEGGRGRTLFTPGRLGIKTKLKTLSSIVPSEGDFDKARQAMNG